MLETETQEAVVHVVNPVVTVIVSAKFKPKRVSDSPPMFGAFLGARCVMRGASKLKS